MKLLIILSVEDHANEVREILARQKVPIYSETEIHGFKTERHQPDITNWFAREDYGVYSTLFFAIQDEKCVKRVIEEVRNYNQANEEKQDNPLHAYQLNVEEAV